MGARREGARVGARAPPPPLGKYFLFLHVGAFLQRFSPYMDLSLCGGILATFFNVGGLFATFSQCEGLFLSLWEAFLGLPPPPPPTKMSAGAHAYMCNSMARNTRITVKFT